MGKMKGYNLYDMYYGCHLYVITSAVHADTLAVVASELVGKASAQLELDTEHFKIKGIYTHPLSLLILFGLRS